MSAEDLSELGLMRKSTGWGSHCWGTVEGSSWNVRGKTYLKDGVKVPSEAALLRPIGADLVQTEQMPLHFAAQKDSLLQKARARGFRDFVFVVNVMLPGPPYTCFVQYWTATEEELRADPRTHRLLQRVVHGKKRIRDERFKLIPRVVEGSWLVKRAVGSKPTILGSKLEQHYFRGDNYLEVDVDVGSSAIARRVVGLAASYARDLVVDMAWVLQGEKEEELPERILATIQCIKFDMKSPVRVAYSPADSEAGGAAGGSS